MRCDLRLDACESPEPSPGACGLNVHVSLRLFVETKAGRRSGRGASQEREAAAQAGRGGADFVVVEAQRRPRQNWRNRASLKLGPPGRHDGNRRRQSLSDVGGAGETPPLARNVPPTSRQFPKRESLRCKCGDCQPVAGEVSGKVAGVGAIDLTRQGAALSADVSTNEVDLALTSRAFGRADRQTRRGEGGLDVHEPILSAEGGSPGGTAPGRRVIVRRPA